MQEIKFRGKRVDNDEWVYGYLVKQFGKFKIYDDSKEDFDNWVFEVDPKTVGQYIGIKDTYGKKVFRGDIVKVKEKIYTNCGREEIEEIKEYTGKIVWHQHGWYIAEKILGGIRYHSLWLWNIEGEEDDDTMEIIDNIHENPKLVEVQ